jgi:HAD superfamily hydrolase (TIGR01458 family)
MSPAIRAVLVDLEGTIVQAGRLLPGARETFAGLENAGIPAAVVTNTTSRPRSRVASELAQLGLPLPAERIFTTAGAARLHLLERGFARCHFLTVASLLEDFTGIAPEDEAPQAVVVGDLGDGFTFERLNRAFRRVLEGAELVALARNRYYRGPEGLLLDVGAFVAALEYGSGRGATLTGKPAPSFFRAALETLGADPSATAVVGDDLESDVHGAQAAGLAGVLVRTGKYRPEFERIGRKPDGVLDSIADLPRLLGLG